MKLNGNPTARNRERAVDDAASSTPPTGEPEALPRAGVLKRLRRLKWNEVVFRGDFVASEHRGFEPWEGPGGFRADTFVKPIYRLYESRSTATRKSKRNTSNP